MVKSIIETRSADETLRLGESIGSAATSRSLILLDGELGTGKSVIAHGIARGLGVSSWRGSPTFNLVHQYAGRLPLIHIDAYRLSPEEIGDLDIDGTMEDGGVAVVEWANNIRNGLLGYQPARTINIQLHDAGGDLRTVEISQ